LYKQSYKNFDLYFVDNGSIDGSSDYVKANYSKAKILRFEKNLGFARGNNEAIKVALKDSKIEYIVCLNNDTIVQTNWLKELILTARKSEEIGAVGSIGIYPNGKIQTAGIRLLPSKTFVEMKTGDLSVGYGQSPTEFKVPFEIFAPSGFSALFKRKALETIGLFDEDFFAFGEDIDLGFRLRLFGFSAFCNPNSRLIHFHSMTGGRASPLKAYLSKRNGFFIAIKNFSLADAILYPIRDIIFTLKSVHSKGRAEEIQRIGILNSIRILLLVYAAVLYYLPKMILKRGKIQKSALIRSKKVGDWFYEKI